MASNEQLNANRTNAMQSTGPRTEQGKDRTSLNSLTHGLARAKIFLPGEQPEDFEEMQRDFARSYDCSTPAELALCAQAALAWWKIRRISEWQNEVIEHGLTGPDLPVEIARLFGPTHEAALKTLHRYEASAHSLFNRALTQLRIHQKQREAAKEGEDRQYERARTDAIDRYVFGPLDDPANSKLQLPVRSAYSPARQGGDSANRANPIAAPNAARPEVK